MPEENPNHRAGEMFMRRCDGAVAPQVADGLRERCDDALQQPLRAQVSRGTLQRLFQRACVERLHCGDAFIEERVSCRNRRHSGPRPRSVAVGVVGFPGELAQFLGRQLRDVSDAVSALRDVA